MLLRFPSGVLGPRRSERSSTSARAGGGGSSLPPPRARRAASAAALALALLFALPGCAGGDGGSDLDLSLGIVPSPPAEGLARLTLTLHDAAGESVHGATVKVEGNMSHAGMVPEFAEAVEIDPGRYEAALEFTMGGDWILTFDVTTQDGAHHVLEREVRGVLSDDS